MIFFNSKKKGLASTRKDASSKRGGFTLIEMLVSVSIFTLVMLIATSAVFTIVASNKKAESLKSVMDNLNFALENMTRNIRTGSNYSCVDTGGNCPGGDTSFSFTPNQSTDETIEYSISNGQIMETDQLANGSWTSPYALTASEISVTKLEFYLVGSGGQGTFGAGLQPRVLMTVIGTAGTSTTATQFKIQTTLSQRQIDS